MTNRLKETGRVRRSTVSFFPSLIAAGILLVTSLILLWNAPSREVSPIVVAPSLIESVPHSLESSISQPKGGSPMESIKLLEEEDSAKRKVGEKDTSNANHAQPVEIEKPLRERVADWRYVGNLITNRKKVAIIQRMQREHEKTRVLEGEDLEGVRIDEVYPSTIIVSLGGEEMEIIRTDDPAYNLEDLYIAPELADEPDLLAQAIYAQTLGQYVSEIPSFEDVGKDGEITPESQTELIDAIANHNGWDLPPVGEGLDSWAEGIAEQEEMGGSQQNPEDYPLNESDRRRILGFDRIGY